MTPNPGLRSARPTPASSAPPGSTLSPLLSEFASDADMHELIAMFVGEMPERVRSLETLWKSRELEPLKRLAHQLKGAGGGYGFSPVSAAAGKLETTLQSALADSGTIEQQSLEAIQCEVNELVTLCRRVGNAASAAPPK